MDRQKVLSIRDKLNEVLKEAGKDLGVELRLGNCTYYNNNATFKLEVAEIGEDGEVHTKEAEDFRARAFMYGLQPEDLGKDFRDFTGKKFTITGLKPRSKKYPILAKDEDGETYKLPTEMVKACLTRA